MNSQKAKILLRYALFISLNVFYLPFLYVPYGVAPHCCRHEGTAESKKEKSEEENILLCLKCSFSLLLLFTNLFSKIVPVEFPQL